MAEMVNNVKLVYIISNTKKSLAFEWLIKSLVKTNIQVSFILLNNENTPLEEYIKKNSYQAFRLNYKGKTSAIIALFQLIKILNRIKPEIIHCHLFEASLLGLLAGKLLNIKKRYYTRHHSSYNWHYNPKGVKLDRFINFLSTDIIAISENVKKILEEKENVKNNKIHLIYHGFDLDYFKKPDKNRINNLKVKYNVIGKSPVIGMISRWIEWKGIEYGIKAFENILKLYPNAVLLLANSNGPYKDTILSYLDRLPENSYRVILFEEDLSSLYQLFDVFVHVPVDASLEAFGQTYIESLAAGIPSIFTLSGIANEFIINEKNALIVPYKNHKSIEDNIIRILNDDKLSKKIVASGFESIRKFNVSDRLKPLINLYEQK